MKKSAIAIAVAATINTGTSIAITSNITGIQLYTWTLDHVIPCTPPFTPGLTLTGFSPNINMTGDVCINSIYPTALSFSLTGTHSASGSIFNGGNIDIYMDFGSGWSYYGTVAASVTAPVNCLAGQPGHLSSCASPVNTTSGLVVPSSGIAPLPGLWHWSGWPIGSPGIDNASCVIDLLGARTGLFLQGTIIN